MKSIILLTICALLTALFWTFKSNSMENTTRSPASHLVQKDDRFSVAKDLEITGLSVWGAPYTGSFKCTLPAGTILVAEHDQVPTAEGFGVVPEKYKEMEKQLVPESDRSQKKYDSYYFVFQNKDIGEKILRK